MAALTRTSHERFCQRIFAGEPQTKAYLAEIAKEGASEKAAAVSAHHLLKRPKIRQRLNELHQAAVGKVVRDKATLIDKAWKLLDQATEAKQYGVVRQTIELLGREYGAFTEHKKITVRRLADMDEQELEAMLSDDDLDTGDKGQAPPGYTH